MDQRTKTFLSGANLAAHWLFKSMGLVPRVLRVAVPTGSLPPDSEPVVEQHPDFPPDPHWDWVFINGLRQLSRRDNSAESSELGREEILTAISKCSGADQFAHFCSYPALVDGYLTCVVLQLSKNAYDAVPRVTDSPHPLDRSVQFSLVDHAIEYYLADCTHELENSDPDPFVGWTPHTEVLRRAAWGTAARAVAVINNGSMGIELFDTCNQLALAQYEKRDSAGSIIVSTRPHPNVEAVVLLVEPVPLGLMELRASRKLLQLSVAGLSLLFDGTGIYGAGKISSGYDVQAGNLFIVEFTKPGTWELRHYEQLLMVVSHGIPRLQIPSFGPDFLEAELRDHLSRLFGPLNEQIKVNLCRLARAACDQEHGTTFIISSGADQEAERLQQQCFRLSPLPLTPSLLPSLTNIDGAVLVDLNGTCHAIGVILDGRVSAQGTASGNKGRGARYNSAVRYAADEKSPRCLIIVRSEDGMVDFLPGVESRSAGSENGVGS